MRPRTPYFEIGIKNYIFGDDVLRIAKAADTAAVRYDVDVMLITPYTEIRRVAEQTERLIVLAPYMDLLRPGRGMADVLPEALQSAGTQGVVINHCERPVPLSTVSATIRRARELGLLSLVCVDTIEEARAVAILGPDIINPEPTELIGGQQASGMDYMQESVRAIKAIDPNIIVEQSGGITTPEQVYELVLAGMEAVGSASGVLRSADPIGMAEAMIRSVRSALDERGRRRVS